jgi:septal ring factor EnvC (AmiA/AmiB activator)
MGVKAAGVGGGGKGSGGGAGSSPALGGVEAPGVGKEAVDFWARAVIAGDRDWQVGLARSKSGSQLIEAVKRRVPELAKEMGLQPQDIGTVRAQKAALDKTLKELTVRSEAIELFASKVEKDMKTFDALLDKASLGIPTIVSRPINVLRREFSSPELAQLDLAAKQVATEYERLITGGALSIAQLHVGAQEDARKLINGDMTPKQARAVMETMNAEMQNARAAAHESRKRVSDQMRNLGTGAPDTGGAAPAAGKPAPPAVGTVKSGYRFKGGNPADKANWERVQ